MESRRFDQFTRLLGRATARRRLLVNSALIPLAGLVLARFAGDTEARKKRKRRKRKQRSRRPKLNEYGCLNVGQPCNGNNTPCCSGICEGTKPKKGKKDTSVCAGHDAGTCFPDTDTCKLGTAYRCDLTNELCFCVLTTGNAGFCGDFTGNTEPLCRTCARDVDCQTEFGAGAACVVLKGACSGNCPHTGRTACVPSCSTESE